MSGQPSDLDALPPTTAPSSSLSTANALRRIRSTGDIPPPRHSLTISPEPATSSRHDSPDHNLPIAPASAMNPTFCAAGGSPSHPTVPSPARTARSSGSRRSRSPGPTLNTNTSPRSGFRRTSTPRITPTTPTATPAAAANQPQTWIRKAMMFFGVGRGASRERKTIVALFFALCSSCVQIIVITVLLALSGTVLKSPKDPGITEWVACQRPLGTWACIWVFRSILASSLNYWSFLRERKIRQQRQADESSGNLTSPALGSPVNNQVPAPPPTPRSTPRRRGRNNPENESIARYSRALPYTQLYSRLTLLSSLLTLSWFLTAHILEYTSIDTCRHTSPHIWWLTFGILCLMYLSVLEVMVLSVVVFIVAPILFLIQLFWNIVLVCMGRHPLQTAGQIRHEIGKLPKSVVDRIPLVIYIPPPPEELAGLVGGLKTPESTYSYPPKPYSPKIAEPRKRFQFLRKFSSFRGDKSKTKKGAGEKDLEKGLNGGEPQTWEEHWEKGEYPFVVLEGNRAACAICLMDFEEPKKLFEAGQSAANASAPTVVGGSSHEQEGEKEEGEVAGADDSAISIVPAAPAVASAPALSTGLPDLALTDAGEGVQPLRLLECGHVFHKTCLDPWLTDVSGRCPTCQRAVVLSEPKGKKTRPNRTERRNT